ncbi:serine hydrolase [Sphingobacterium sp. HJSM2_6]|uniref:serine hydrolase n=1 Tax=Sphingobacterium sp. HJSM2_6 TaxID=3366264 RepID=UPI003BE1D106
MKNIILITLLFNLIAISSNAQKTDKKLSDKLHKEITGFKGDIGIYVKHLKSQKEVNIMADSIFPTASIVKVPLLVGVFQKIHDKQLSLNQKFLYDDARTYGGSGLMQFYKDSTQTDLSTMISLMLTYSDNVASIWCQELAGAGLEINPLMDKLGLSNTRVNSRTKGRELDWKKYGWGQTTAKEMAQLFEYIRLGKVISPAISDKMYRFLKNQYYNERSLSQFPAHINCISKTGSVNEARAEVVLVNAPHGDFVFSVFTKNNKDQRWTNQNEAEELTRRIARIIWNHYEEDFEPYELIN